MKVRSRSVQASIGECRRVEVFFALFASTCAFVTTLGNVETPRE